MFNAEKLWAWIKLPPSITVVPSFTKPNTLSSSVVIVPPATVNVPELCKAALFSPLELIVPPSTIKVPSLLTVGAAEESFFLIVPLFWLSVIVNLPLFT